MSPHPHQRIAWLAVAALLLVSCGSDAATEDAKSYDPRLEAFWSTTSPENPSHVLDVRESGQDGTDVVVRGRVKDFVDGRAVFTVTDSALQPCDPEECCPTPWDYCCNSPDTIAEHTLTVELHGDDGRLIRSGLEGFHGLDHLQFVTVTGKVKRDDQGNVTLVTTSVYRE